MFARVTSSQVSPDKADEAISIMRDTVLPMMRQQKGCPLLHGSAVVENYEAEIY